MCALPITQIAIGKYLLKNICFVIGINKNDKYAVTFNLSHPSHTGAVYLNDCPQQHYIPIYLLVLGTFALLLGVPSCLPCTRESVDGANSILSTFCNVWNSMMSFFLFCWFIAGESQHEESGGGEGKARVIEEGEHG